MGYKLLKRPKILFENLKTLPYVKEMYSSYSLSEIESAEILMKYEDYIIKESQLADKMIQLEDMKFPIGYNFKEIKTLSNEARNKLSEIEPKTIGQASRISGVSPADIQILMVYLNR